MATIDWESFSKFWTPEPGSEHRLILTNWQQTTGTFGGEERQKLTFDVWAIDNMELSRPKEFSVGGANAVKFRPIIENNKTGEIDVMIMRDKNNRYTIVDMALVTTVAESVNRPRRRA